MKNNGFSQLVAFLNKLEQQGITYTLDYHRDEAIMVTVSVPGERWEVEFFEDGEVEVEKFTSGGEIYGEEVLSELFAMYSEAESTPAEFPQNAELAITT